MCGSLPARRTPGPQVSDLLVLCYHAVSERWTAPLAVTPTQLERQVALLAARGYRGVTFTQGIGTPGEDRRVAITFDDGYRSVAELAAPILERFAMPATVFVPTDYVERAAPLAWPGTEHWLGGAHEDELAPLSWGQLCQLQRRGWEIGSHTCSHPRLTTLDDEALADELARSRLACERRLDEPCRALAYPYGDCDARVAAAAAQAGYSVAGTLPRRLVGEGPLRVPRVGIDHADDSLRFRLKVSRPVRALRASAAWNVLRPAPTSSGASPDRLERGD